MYRGTRLMDGEAGGFGQVIPVNDAAGAQELLERLSAPTPAPLEQEMKAPDPLLLALTSVTFNAERKLKRDEWIAARLEANKIGQELLKDQVKENHEAFVAEHVACRARLRQQATVVAALDGKLDEWKREVNRLDELFAQRRAELESAEQERANLPRFASDAEVGRADGAVRKAQGLVEKVSKGHAEAVQQLNYIVYREYPPEKKKRDEIEVELNAIEARLNGASADAAERLAFGFIT